MIREKANLNTMMKSRWKMEPMEVEQLYDDYRHAPALSAVHRPNWVPETYTIFTYLLQETQQKVENTRDSMLTKSFDFWMMMNVKIVQRVFILFGWPHPQTVDTEAVHHEWRQAKVLPHVFRDRMTSVLGQSAHLGTRHQAVFI